MPPRLVTLTLDADVLATLRGATERRREELSSLADDFQGRDPAGAQQSFQRWADDCARAVEALDAAIAAPAALTVTFPRQERAWAAAQRAETALRDAGFSVGPICKDAPRGILIGAIAIQKWRNLDAADRAALHGRLEGDARVGPLTVTLYAEAPEAARAAFADVVAAASLETA